MTDDHVGDAPGAQAPQCDAPPGTVQVRAGDADFDALYASTPPWDIGRPQLAFEELASQGGLAGLVLDAGCGTGEHALMAAALDLEAMGVDVSARALAQARAKARGG